jgi:hypothetical protein
MLPKLARYLEEELKLSKWALPDTPTFNAVFWSHCARYVSIRAATFLFHPISHFVSSIYVTAPFRDVD